MNFFERLLRSESLASTTSLSHGHRENDAELAVIEWLVDVPESDLFSGTIEDSVLVRDSHIDKGDIGHSTG